MIVVDACFIVPLFVQENESEEVERSPVDVVRKG